MWNQELASKNLGEELPHLALDKSKLQLNNEQETRIPTALTTLIEHHILVVGFDNGELQTYAIEDLNKTYASWQAGPGFVTGSGKPIIVLDSFCNWNPFPDDPNDEGRKSSVFYAGSAESNCVFLYWVLDNEVQLTWVKFQMLNYVLTDACLCPGMSKLVTGTTRGRILLFNAKIKGQIVNSHSPIKEHSETNLMVKVAHEGSVTCVTSNKSGYLIITGGKDGKICIWQWSGDHFPHQVGQLYLTNLPIQGIYPVQSSGKDPGEIWLAIDDYILNLKVWNRTSQVYVMEQQPSKNIKLPKGNKKEAMKSKSIFLINPEASTLILLRPSKAVVIANPPGKCINMSQVPIMKFSVDETSSGDSFYSFLMMSDNNEPSIQIWKKSSHGIMMNGQ